MGQTGGSNTGESEGHGWIRWGGGVGGVGEGGMFVSITPWFQQGDRLKKYFLGCQRKGPLTGGLRHHKSSVILSMPLFSPLTLSYFDASNSLCTENNPIQNFRPRVSLNLDPHTLSDGRNFDTIPICWRQTCSKPSVPVQPCWTLSADTSLSSNLSP